MTTTPDHIADVPFAWISDRVYTYPLDVTFQKGVGRYYVLVDGVTLGWVLRTASGWQGYRSQCGDARLVGEPVAWERTRGAAADEMVRRSLKRAAEWWLYSNEAPAR